MRRLKVLLSCETQQIYGKKIILVDDVATALATCSECSQTLLNAGAKEVNVVVAGRDLMGS
jgi:predicted amidophosphoribosyltransferase